MASREPPIIDDPHTRALWNHVVMNETHSNCVRYIKGYCKGKAQVQSCTWLNSVNKPHNSFQELIAYEPESIVCQRDWILLWFSKVSELSSPNALLALALSPFGGSFVTLTLFCNTVTGKDLLGMELRNSRKSSCTSASGDDRFFIRVSIANIQEAARWQF